LEPDRLADACEAFDHTWTLIETEWCPVSQVHAEARLKVARVVLALARNGGQRQEVLKRSAVRILELSPVAQEWRP
jgi:hypothetical protein